MRGGIHMVVSPMHILLIAMVISLAAAFGIR